MRAGVAIGRVGRLSEGRRCRREGNRKECNSGHGRDSSRAWLLDGSPSLERDLEPPMRREVARFGPCVSLRNLTGSGDGSAICDADEIRRNGSDETNGSQWFSFSVPFPNHFWTGSGNTPLAIQTEPTACEPSEMDRRALSGRKPTLHGGLQEAANAGLLEQA